MELPFIMESRCYFLSISSAVRPKHAANNAKSNTFIAIHFIHNTASILVRQFQTWSLRRGFFRGILAFYDSSRKKDV